MGTGEWGQQNEMSLIPATATALILLFRFFCRPEPGNAFVFSLKWVRPASANPTHSHHGPTMPTRLIVAALIAACVSSTLASTLAAAELIQLTEKNYQSLCPAGKEPDAILGDWVLRNEHIVAVIAAPGKLRNANMTVRNVGGMLIDLSLRGVNSDQLSCFYPAGNRYNFHDASSVIVELDGRGQSLTSAGRFEARRLSITLLGTSSKGDGSQAKVTYTLGDGDEALAYQVQLTNQSAGQLELLAQDLMRCDGPTYKFGNEEGTRLLWAEDRYYQQAYGWLPDSGVMQRAKDGRAINHEIQDAPAMIDAGQSRQWGGKILCSQALPGIRTMADALRNNQPAQLYQLKLNSSDDNVANAEVEFFQGDQSLGLANTDSQGWVRMRLKQGDYRVLIKPYSRPVREHSIKLGVNALAESLTVDAASRIEAQITDSAGQGLPAKLQIVGVEPTASPNFGPDTAESAIRNLLYTASGKVSHPLAPGKYTVIVSRGPEYDAVTESIEVKAGIPARLKVALERTVDSTGWVGGEFHSHSTPSGDNTSLQRGRVLNLLAENLEFAPCTEHNRIDTYEDDLQALKATKWMATCTGMELTGSPLPVNHQNAFPMQHKPRTQDGGAPVTDENPEVQIERLAMWDGKSDKVVQMNHPHLAQIMNDRDLDGKSDAGFRKMFEFTDVIEIHPLETIFKVPAADTAPRDRGANRMFHWMLMLNMGYRTPGVVNTDAHYNWHGSGWLRNYIASSTDDPAQITTAEMQRAIEAGHMVMTSAPFLQTELRATLDGKSQKFIPGSSVALASNQAKLWIRVQCANWYDINRVQVFANGRPLPEMNFTRGTHANLFRNGVVRFETEIDLPKLKEDTHLIVATIGEGLQLGDVMGSEFGKNPPVAVANPIYVDIDGNGFKPSGDDLGISWMK